MANVNLQRTSWGYGELDQRMLGRTDLQTYRQGVVKMENWLPAKSGAAVMRGGMEQVKSVPTTFVADCIMPLRGGTSPLLGLYDSTNQKFRVIKADGTWVGTEAAPAEVTLVHSVTVVEQDGDDEEPYEFTLNNNATTDHPDGQNEAIYGALIAGYDDKDGEESAANAFIDYINTYSTPPKASCFKIRLTKGSAVQDFSLEGGTVTIDEVETGGTGSQITFEPPVPRPDSYIINPAFAGKVTAYIDHVAIDRTTIDPDDPIVAAKLTLNVHNAATGGVLQPEAAGARQDLGSWETGGKVSVLFNDDPGVLPLWAVEPNVAYDSVTVRLFRPNSDVKVYTITDTTITEDSHDEGATDLVGAVHNGKHASHGAYFEQRIVYGGGRNHRQEIVGSRSPNPLTGDRRYGQWALNDQTTTSVAGTSTAIFIPSGMQQSHGSWDGGGDGSPAAGGYLNLTFDADRREIHQDFTFGASRRTLSGLQFGQQSYWQEGEAMFHMMTGSLDALPNENRDGDPSNTDASNVRGNGANNNGKADRTGRSNWSRNWELNGRVRIDHGTEELEILMNNPNSSGDNLTAANSTIRITPAGGNPDLNEQQATDSVTQTNTTHQTIPGFKYVNAASSLHNFTYYNLVGGYHVPLHEGNSLYQFHDPVIGADNHTKNVSTGVNGAGAGATVYKVCKLSSDEKTALRDFIQYIEDLGDPDAASFTVTCEIGTTSSVTTTTVNSDNAFQWVIDTGTTHAEVRWLQVYSGVLVAGTSAGIALCKFLNPDDPPEIRWHSSQCVSRKPPLSTPLGILAVSADKTSIYEVIKKRELTAYSEDRFRKDKIHTIAWQQQPQQRLWVVTEAGKIHVLTIQDENAVNGWAQITHQHTGTCTGVVVTNGDDADDTVWFLMKYGAQSYVEKYHEATTDLHSNRVFMDSAVKRTVGHQTISMATSALANVGAHEGAQRIVLKPVVELDNKLGAMFVGSSASRYIFELQLKDEDGSTADQVELNVADGSGVGASYDLGSDFESNGRIRVEHQNAVSGENLALEIPMSATDDTSDPYQWTEAQLGGIGSGGSSDKVEEFVDNMRAVYPDSVGGNDVPGSANFKIILKLVEQKIAIPDNMVNVSGKKLLVTSAAAAGNISETTHYEIHDSPATSVLDTNFAYGQDVWVGFQVIADMELPPIDRSISGRIAGSWLGQPARIPWTVAGVEKSHSVKIGPTYAKLVEYCADTTPLSVTISMTQTTDTSEPYVWTTGGFDEAEVVAWFNAVRALNADADGAYGGNRFTQTLVAGGVTQTITAHSWDVDASSIDLVFPFRPANQIHSTIAGGNTRFPAGTQVSNLGQVTLMFDVGGGSGASAGHDLSNDFETSGTLTLTYTHPAPLVTGHERRDLPDHVTTSSPVVIRKDTPSPCTLTYMVIEATAG